MYCVVGKQVGMNGKGHKGPYHTMRGRKEDLQLGRYTHLSASLIQLNFSFIRYASPPTLVG